MPIGKASNVSRSFGGFYIPGALSGMDLRKGATVSAIYEDDQIKIMECSANLYAKNFCGFAAQAVLEGNPILIIGMRGSSVTPIIEDVAFIEGSDVLLSLTQGEVTTTPFLFAPGLVILRVGFATDSVSLVLAPDYRVTFGG